MLCHGQCVVSLAVGSVVQSCHVMSVLDLAGQFFSVSGDSSVFVLSRTGHFEYSPVHNSVNIDARNFILHLHGSCHICVSMCVHNFFVNYFNWLIYS